MRFRDDDVHADAGAGGLPVAAAHRRAGEAAPLVQVAETLDKRSRWPPRSSRA
jgi:hypothetical protein